MAIHTLHGIVDAFMPGQQICRNYVPREALFKYLSNRKDQYVDWEGDDTKGDIITVDDSTKAGADACLLIRSLGHKVIFFVNPWQIIAKDPYFFTLLDASIDKREAQLVYYNKTYFNMKEASRLRDFRKECKRVLMMMAPSTALITVCDVIAKLLAVRDLESPQHLRPITLEELHELKNAGVRIESHGWSHINISAFSKTELIKDLEQTYDWLKNQLSVSSCLYAVPFGFPEINIEPRQSIMKEYFLLDQKLPLGKIASNCWNRTDLCEQIQAGY